jgi:phosphoribosylformimino-5-aminoimidazole carboxamide ribotide isomerase
MIEIIPAIDLMDGRCVRLEQGDFARKTLYDADPIEVAKRFRGAGLRRLHMVDLDGARSGRPQNLETLERVAMLDGLVIDFGGGVRTKVDAASVIDSGASLVNIGSLTVKHPELFAEMVHRFGPDKFLPGADARDGFVAVHGWADVTSTPVSDQLAKFRDLGIKSAFVTDVSRDGMMEGPALGFYKELINGSPGIRLIASGGVRNIADLLELRSVGCAGAIVGKAFYEGSIKLAEVAGYVGKADSAVS